MAKYDASLAITQNEFSGDGDKWCELCLDIRKASPSIPY